MRITVYLHSSKETMWEQGHDAGLTEEALEMFKYACYEVAVVLEVDQRTGKAEIVAVDGRPLGPRP